MSNCNRDRKKKLTPYFVFIMLLFTIIVVSALVNTNIVGPVDSEGNVKVNISWPLEVNGGIPVNVQDQTTRPFDIRVNQILNSTNYELTIVPTVESYNLTLNTTVGLIVGDNVAVLEQNGMPQLFFGSILAVNGNTLTLDTQVPFNFTLSNSVVFEFENSLVVDGSIDPKIFTITNLFDESIDITRFIFHCTDGTAMDDSKFCGDTALTRGLVLRKGLNDGNFINYWNIKSNGEWGEFSFDKNYDDKAPAGLFGFSARLTYGGQSKHGVVIRLAPGESIQLLIQDDLTPLVRAILMVEGHFIQN